MDHTGKHETKRPAARQAGSSAPQWPGHCSASALRPTENCVFLLLSPGYIDFGIWMSAIPDTQPSKREFISTAQAARQLGLSLGTVQNMVEAGALSGWKTAGGHRRIWQDSVDALLARGRAPGRTPSGTLRVLIVEDDKPLQALYRETFSTWPIPLELNIVDHGLDALVELGREQPDLLITDLRMPGVDGFETIRRLRTNPLSSRTSIVVISALSAQEIAARGSLPKDVTIYRKPIPFHELHGYIQALSAQRRRTHGGA